MVMFQEGLQLGEGVAGVGFGAAVLREGDESVLGLKNEKGIESDK